MKYRSGYKYQIAKEYVIRVRIRPGRHIETEFIRLTVDGLLTIHQGYAWNGASGAPDIPSIMRGSLVHDALYQIMRNGWLHSGWREAADRELQRICREAGMLRLAAWIVYRTVRIKGARSITKYAVKQVQTAP